MKTIEISNANYEALLTARLDGDNSLNSVVSMLLGETGRITYDVDEELTKYADQIKADIDTMSEEVKELIFDALQSTVVLTK